VSAPLLRAPIPLPDGLGIPAEDWRETPTRVRPPGLSLRQRVEALDARLPRDSSTARRRPAPEALSAKRQRRQQAAERRQPGATPGPPGHHQGLWAPTASVSLFPDGWAWGQPGARLSSSLTRTRAGHAPLCLLQAPLGGGLQGEAWRAARWATRRGPRSTPGDTAHGCQGAWARGQGEAARAGARCPTCAPRCAASPGGKGRSRQGWIGCLRRWAPMTRPLVRGRAPLWGTTVTRRRGACTGLGRSWGAWLSRPVASLQRHPQCSQAAFAQRIGAWRGSRVREGAGGYQAWQGLRQSCVAPLLRPAQGLAERVEAGLARLGQRVHPALQGRSPMGTARPPVGQGRAWSARFRGLVNPDTARPD
jgi:hypothetical protein